MRRGTSQEKAAVEVLKREGTGLYADLFEGIQTGLIILQLEGINDAKTLRIVDLNSAAAELLGLTAEDLLGKTSVDLPKFFKTEFPNYCQGVVVSGKARDLGEIHYGDEPSTQLICSAMAYPLPNRCVALALENITERKRAEQALRKSEERFRLLVEGVSDYAIFMLDTEGRVLTWNTGAERMKGYRAEEITGKPFSVFFLPEAIQLGKPQSELREAAEKGKCEDEGWRLRKDGSRFWANVLITALRDQGGKLCGFAKVTRDMTDRREREEALRNAKAASELRVAERSADVVRANRDLQREILERNRAEEQLRASLGQLRALTARLQSAREEERTLVAREIHDELGQACTALKMDLVWLVRRLPKSETQLHEKADSMLKLIDGTIHSMRRIASELRPSTLDDLGLTAAIEWQAQEFESRAGIKCHVAFPKEDVVMDQDRSTAIFRIFQETLTNVARHANATQVNVDLMKDPESLTLEVRDNGKGIDVAQTSNPKSLGLLGMRERATLVGGQVEIMGSPGKGTTVTVRVPLRERRKRQESLVGFPDRRWTGRNPEDSRP